jgi:hypothetical protein
MKVPLKFKIRKPPSEPPQKRLFVENPVEIFVLPWAGFVQSRSQEVSLLRLLARVKSRRVLTPYPSEQIWRSAVGADGRSLLKISLGYFQFSSLPFHFGVTLALFTFSEIALNSAYLNNVIEIGLQFYLGDFSVTAAARGAAVFG